MQKTAPLCKETQSQSVKKGRFFAAFSDIVRTGDEDAEERSRATTSGRNAVYRYAGTQGTPAAEDRRSGEFRTHWVKLKFAAMNLNKLALHKWRPFLLFCLLLLQEAALLRCKVASLTA